MRIFRDDSEYQGTPEEIAQFFMLNDANIRNIEMKMADPIELPYDTWETEEDLRGNDEGDIAKTVRESEELRKKLALDPNYNPFPGVSPSPESAEGAHLNIPTAEQNTGVEFV